MEALKIVLRVVLLLVSLGLAVIVLMQSAKTDAMAAYTGGENSAMSARPKGKDAILGRWTKIAAVVMFVLCVASVILEKF